MWTIKEPHKLRKSPENGLRILTRLYRGLPINDGVGVFVSNPANWLTKSNQTRINVRFIIWRQYQGLMVLSDGTWRLRLRLESDSSLDECALDLNRTRIDPQCDSLTIVPLAQHSNQHCKFRHLCLKFVSIKHSYCMGDFASCSVINCLIDWLHESIPKQLINMVQYLNYYISASFIISSYLPKYFLFTN